ncbi:glycoside hydrolase family 3 C-terminal domain-containing protein [Sphingomonas sp. CGMCC 1.13654]|uniref:beta-glucosidase n=1 Tax=Sphingomonas chungangi TaxID=2683589 RepID=A0A838LAW4_9SPHN|nr:glycoside hydrolase family 3 N-terminal domain-containing protein [Sphingomonas chungangi]MBA2936000.1 glycoside hydrolase family 3 C-terminal domain-containing protein [Sphingomonas chungangi]MVW55390.1 beta-glucosidase [Sphingomonas chungangi]
MTGEIGRRALLAGAGAAGLAGRAFGLALGPSPSAAPGFVGDLIAKMTPDEKAGQLSIMASAIGGGAATKLNPVTNTSNVSKQLADARAGRMTGIFNGQGADWHRRLQQEAVKSRLGIPLLFAADVIHGMRTVFPVPLAEAASFDPDLAMRTARTAAYEASAAGIALTFAPMVDIARDQRWGRGVEAAGEDVLVGTRFAAARVKGFQGESLARDDAVAACAKHFAAYGAGEAGLDYNSVDISERTLREVYFPPFQSALGAGAASLMPSFNEIDGIPSSGNRWLLSDVLRGEWNFRGLVISDYTADEEMIAAGFAKDGRDAAKKAILAGVDVSMQSGLYQKHLPDLVKSGEVPMARVDDAVRRVLELKVRLGLFDDPFNRLGPGREQQRILTPIARDLAREAAQRSMVLLKNQGGVLPLKADGAQTIALIGPHAAGPHDLIGPWNVYGDDAQAIDLATGLRAAMRDPARLTVTAGSDVEKPIAGGIETAVAAARAADVVLLAIGESQEMSGEAQSRTEVVLPWPQQRLAEAVVATGKPVIVILKNGRALALEGAVLDAQAILVTWFLGTETGHALADILFGTVCPSGRLPVSFPYESGQEPLHYDHKPTGRPAPEGPRQPFKAQYRTAPDAARFAFGHGLTYGEIDYSGLELGGGKLAGEGLIISAEIRNHGDRSAEEVVQLYVHPRVSGITQPVRRLIDWQRVKLAPGGSAKVRFTITREMLMRLGPDLKPAVEPGTIDIWIAPSAQDGLKGTFELS